MILGTKIGIGLHQTALTHPGTHGHDHTGMPVPQPQASLLT